MHDQWVDRTWAAVARSVTAVGLFLLAPAPAASAASAAAAPVAQAPAPAPKAGKPAAQASRPAPARNFKESGNVLAPIACELFTDYECPHCATVFLQVIPGFVKDYVRTGKVKLIHRDYPLPQQARRARHTARAAGPRTSVVDRRSSQPPGGTGDIGRCRVLARAL